MHVSAIINKNLERMNAIKRIIRTEKCPKKVSYFKEVLEAIREHQAVLIRIEIKSGGPFRGVNSKNN